MTMPILELIDIFFVCLGIVYTIHLIVKFIKWIKSKKKIINETKTYVSAGDAIFGVLKELCNTPSTELDTEFSLLAKLNKGMITDAPYYGFGPEEFKILHSQGIYVIGSRIRKKNHYLQIKR